MFIFFFSCKKDVIGVVKSTSDIDTVVGRTSQKEFIKRDILLVDENASITVTLWGQQVERNFKRQNEFLF